MRCLKIFSPCLFTCELGFSHLSGQFCTDRTSINTTSLLARGRFACSLAVDTFHGKCQLVCIGYRDCGNCAGSKHQGLNGSVNHIRICNLVSLFMHQCLYDFADLYQRSIHFYAAVYFPLYLFNSLLIVTFYLSPMVRVIY